MPLTPITPTAFNPPTLFSSSTLFSASTLFSREGTVVAVSPNVLTLTPKNPDLL